MTHYPHSSRSPSHTLPWIPWLLSLRRLIVVVGFLSSSALCVTAQLRVISYQTQGARWFVIFAGGVLGVSAALLWSAQGSIMMSYPLEKDKGKAFGVFWAIFQFGSFIGSIIALAINIRSGKLSSVSTATYLVRLIYVKNFTPRAFSFPA